MNGRTSTRCRALLLPAPPALSLRPFAARCGSTIRAAAVAWLVASGCSSANSSVSDGAADDSLATGSGGQPRPGSGGRAGSGGAIGSGGETGTGGAVGSGGGAGSGGATGSGGKTGSANITIDTQTRYQVIDGFGAALPMWGSASGMWTTDEVHKLVGTAANELGLTIVRTIIDPDSSRWSFAVNDLKEAKAYGSGVKVLASPWSPPASMKSNGSTKGGGYLLPARYADYAKHLDSYVQYMAGQGVTIDVVSIQNEPDWSPDYDGCEWTGEQLRAFVRDNAASIKGTKLMIAESLGYNRKFTDPALNDATAVNNIAYIGGHLYGAEASGNLAAYPLAEQKGKNRWMTEWNFHEADGSGAAIWGGDNKAVWDETLDVIMRSVHMSMDVKWSAYVWWWGRRYYSFLGDGDSAFGTTKGAILKRGWAFSHYSKFVRPGYTRVAVKMSTTYNSMYLTAYEGDSKIVVVMLNRSSQEHDNVVFETPSAVTAAEAYVTSQSANRTALTVTPAGKYATLARLPARSIVTVVMAY